MIQCFILTTVMKLLWLIVTMLVTIDLLSIFCLTSHHHLITGHSVLIVTWKKCVRDFLWLYYNAEDEKCRICEMFPPRSTTEDHPRAKFPSEAVGAWQTIQNVIEANIDARKYKLIVVIKFSLLARFRCCMWTSLLRKEKLVTFHLQILKLSSILQQWQLLALSLTLDIK